MNRLGRITLNLLVMEGKPCIRGIRITVGNIVRLLAAGHSTAEILDEFPELEEEDIVAETQQFVPHSLPPGVSNLPSGMKFSGESL